MQIPPQAFAAHNEVRGNLFGHLNSFRGGPVRTEGSVKKLWKPMRSLHTETRPWLISRAPLGKPVASHTAQACVDMAEKDCRGLG